MRDLPLVPKSTEITLNEKNKYGKSPTPGPASESCAQISVVRQICCSNNFLDRIWRRLRRFEFICTRRPIGGRILIELDHLKRLNLFRWNFCSGERNADDDWLWIIKLYLCVCLYGWVSVWRNRLCGTQLFVWLVNLFDGLRYIEGGEFRRFHRLVSGLQVGDVIVVI